MSFRHAFKHNLGSVSGGAGAPISGSLELEGDASGAMELEGDSSGNLELEGTQ